MSENKSDGHGNLTFYIIGAIIGAIATGFVAPEIAVKFKVGGEVFLSLLMMMVVPLVVMSVMSGILGLGDVRKLGKPGACAVAYYMCTTVLAVITGLIVVNILKLGVDKEVAAAQAKVESTTGTEKVEAEKELAAIKAKKLKKVKDKASSDEKAAQAAEEKKKRVDAEAAWIMAKENRDAAATAFTAAETALKQSPDDKSLKAKVEEARGNKDSAD